MINWSHYPAKYMFAAVTKQGRVTMFTRRPYLSRRDFNQDSRFPGLQMNVVDQWLLDDEQPGEREDGGLISTPADFGGQLYARPLDEKVPEPVPFKIVTPPMTRTEAPAVVAQVPSTVTTGGAGATRFLTEPVTFKVARDKEPFDHLLDTLSVLLVGLQKTKEGTKARTKLLDSTAQRVAELAVQRDAQREIR